MSSYVSMDASPNIVFVGKRVQRAWLRGGDYLPEFKEAQKYVPTLKMGIEVVDASGEGGVEKLASDQTANTQLLVVNMDDPSVKAEFLEKVKSGEIAKKFPNATIMATTYGKRLSDQTRAELRSCGIQKFHFIHSNKKIDWFEFCVELRNFMEKKVEPANILFLGLPVTKGNAFENWLGLGTPHSPEMTAAAKGNLCQRQGELINALGSDGLLYDAAFDRRFDRARVVVVNADSSKPLAHLIESLNVDGDPVLKQAHILATSYQATFPIETETALRKAGVKDFYALGPLHKGDVDAVHAKGLAETLRKMMARPIKTVGATSQTTLHS